MRALKALVTIMAVIIVIGTGAVIWGIARQASKLSEPPESSPPLTGTSIIGEEREPWQALALDQPAGTRIAAVTSAGDLVILHLYTETPGRDERLVVIDPGSGVLIGTITVGARP